MSQAAHRFVLATFMLSALASTAAAGVILRGGDGSRDAAAPTTSGGLGMRLPVADDGQGDGLSDILRQFGHGFGTVTPGGAGRMPNGGTVIGPGGVVAPDSLRPPRRAERKAPPKPTLEQKQAEIRRSLVPRTPVAQARRKTLDDLYAKLAAAPDEQEAQSIASLISAIWQRPSSDTAALLMTRADAATHAHDYAAALRVLDKLVQLQPGWAEAWNRRATVRFLAGDIDGSMGDVEHVLKLEPKHFAALGGLAMMLRQTGFDKQALQVYRRAAAIYPHQPGMEETIDKLSLEVEGQGI